MGKEQAVSDPDYGVPTGYVPSRRTTVPPSATNPLGLASVATSVQNAVQIAGTHYKGKAIQPWDYVAANELGYFEGTAIKYLTRWKDKGGVDDLRKAVHFIEKLIELQA